MKTLGTRNQKGIQIPPQPPAPPGFERINRYWDNQHKAYAAKITPGEYYVSANAEIITTVLGSCISACVWDKTKSIGGMNHFMLPKASEHSSGAWNNTPVGAATRYGNVAMERLINSILVNGATRKNLAFKIFGGAKVLDIDSDVGRRNIDFVTHFLSTEGYITEALDVGGLYPRKIMFYPNSGRVRVRILHQTQNQTLGLRERVYYRRLDSQPVQGEITVFDD